MRVGFHTFSTIDDVVASRMCIGCGACVQVCPEKKIDFFNVLNEGLRPKARDHKCGECDLCVQSCPMVSIVFPPRIQTNVFAPELPPEQWGNIIGIYEGHASDSELRYQGSSGGVLSALGLYALEKGGMDGVLHISADANAPLFNRTRLSTNRIEVLEGAGSRYAPASICNRLDLLAQCQGTAAVVGKPSDIAALRKLQDHDPSLTAKVGITLSFFCAETPASTGSLELLNKLGVDPASVVELRYRGRGWPGHYSVVQKGASEPRDLLTYKDSWAFLQKFRPWGVQFWPDGTGEFADIVAGDAWYRTPDGKNAGSSIVVSRTSRGEAFLRAAIDAGYVQLEASEPWKLSASQRGLISKKGAVWGRIAGSRMLGLAAPRFIGASLFACWRVLPLAERIRSVAGTVRRIVGRRLYMKHSLDTSTARISR